MWLHCKIEPQKKFKNGINTKLEKYRDLIWVAVVIFWAKILHFF
jgi:hypothetical protein